jgi:hypothetical protein
LSAAWTSSSFQPARNAIHDLAMPVSLMPVEHADLTGTLP